MKNPVRRKLGGVSDLKLLEKMNPFQAETLRLIILFFVPGFISLKVYDLYVPSERRDFSKSLWDAVSFGSINFALMYWAIVEIHEDDFVANHPVWYWIATIIILFVVPVILPILFTKITSTSFFRRKLIDPIPKPWDYVFGQKRSFWIIIHLRDGRRIGGRYDTESFSSSYPAPEQIYLQELWNLDETGKFTSKVERTKGIIISADQFQSIELFQ